MRGDMLWKIVYSPPATPNDQDRGANAATVSFQFEGDGPFSNRSFVEISDQDESFQNLKTKLTNLSNTAKYQLHRNLNVDMLSSLNKTETDLVDVSYQETKALSNKTNFKWAPKKGLTSDFSHAFDRNTSLTRVDTVESSVTSRLHGLTSTTRIDNKGFNNVMTLKGNLSFLRDDKQYGTDQYTTSIINQFKLKLLEIKLEPRHDLKYTISKVHEPQGVDSLGNMEVLTSKTKEIESKFAVVGVLPSSRKFGDIKFKLEYNYRNRMDDVGSNSTGRYLADLSSIRKFGDSFRLLLSLSRVLETYGGSTPTPGPNPGQGSIAKPDEKQATYRIDGQWNPQDNISLGTGYVLIKQDGNTITKVSATLNATIPGLKLPIKSFITSETRDIVGLPSQVTTNAETKLSHRIREITIIFSYLYMKEQLVGQLFTLHEAKLQINRGFGLF
jgi:hypothetical protein